MSQYSIKEEGNFKYIETEGDGPAIILLHGLMGALSNFESLLTEFGSTNKVLIPILPIFEISVRVVSVAKLVDFVEEFVHYKGLNDFYLLGNSLGGHIAQLYSLKFPHHVRGMILTGSSGLFESAMGSTFPKRGNYEFIKQKAESVFYDPKVATKELVDEVYDTVNDLRKALSVVVVAKSAVRHNLEDKLGDLLTPTLLVWGIQDNVTPIWVGEKFHEKIVNSELVKVDKSGHAPMMERPEIFNAVLTSFMSRVDGGTFVGKNTDDPLVFT